jgi:uncharacterized protein
MTTMKKTVVIGASDNPERYSYLAIKKLTANHHPVEAIGKRAGKVGGVIINTVLKPLENIDTISLYINPSLQPAYYSYILSLHPKRIIFNPGTENEELAAIASVNGIASIEACTLVMLSTGTY